MKIVQDTREQTPWQFPEHDVRVATLTSGDYSLAGLEHLVSIERKELNDLVSCCGPGRERFKRELHRLQSYRCRAVIVEGTLIEILGHRYKSAINPASVVGSLASWTARYQMSFILAGNRIGAEAFAEAMLKNFLKQCEQFAASVAAAM